MPFKDLSQIQAGHCSPLLLTQRQNHIGLMRFCHWQCFVHLVDDDIGDDHDDDDAELWTEGT